MARPAPSPGRACPVSYRYDASALAGNEAVQADTLWVAGGLYGNPFALARLLERYDAEPGSKALVFNGDFHWFDVAPEDFAAIDAGVAPHWSTRGNVETELASPDATAGCGCGYPEWVGDETVGLSNRILERLRATARTCPPALARLAGLPMHMSARVGDARVGIVHGDLESLAGWGFSQEALGTAAGSMAAQRSLARAGAAVIACSHTCLPVLQSFPGGRAIVNNGAAGMPNFRGGLYGLATRISVAPGPDAVYGMRAGGLYVEAVPIAYDRAAWQARFLEQWPPGSEAHRSYFARIAEGPGYSRAQALRPAPALAA